MSLLLLRDLKLLTQCSALVLFRFSRERSRFLLKGDTYRPNLTAFKMVMLSNIMCSFLSIYSACESMEANRH